MYAATLLKSVTAGSEPIIEEGWEYRRVGEVVWTKTQNANINNLAQDTEYEFYAYAVTNSYPMTKGETLKFRTLKATADLDAADYGVKHLPEPGRQCSYTRRRRLIVRSGSNHRRYDGQKGRTLPHSSR